MNDSYWEMTPVCDAQNGTPSATTVNLALLQFRNDSRFWIQRVLLPIIGTIGFFGNAVTIVVLTRRGMRSSTNAYLTALAISDLAYLFCVFWLSLNYYPQMNDPSMEFYCYTRPYGLWLTDASSSISVWLTVSFTVERYIAVCHPIRGRILCTESRARRVIVAVYISCFTATITTPFEWTVTDHFNPRFNRTVPIVVPSSLGKNDTYYSIYYWFSSITFVLLPLTLLIIFNSFLIQSVRQSQNLRRSMARPGPGPDDPTSHNEIRITVTLIAVVIMFLVCQLPTAATLIYTIFYHPKSESDEAAVLRGLGNIFNFLVTVNAACNFLLYCALSDRYRRTFVRTFCPCLYRSSSPNHSMAFYTTHPGSSSPEYSCNSRQASLRIANNSSRKSSDMTSDRRRGNGATNSAAGSYLAIPPGNGSLYRYTSHSRSLRERATPTGQIIYGRCSSVRMPCHAAGTEQRKISAPARYSTELSTKWWPWNRTSKPPLKSNILIQISDVEDSHHNSDLQDHVDSV